MQYFQSKTSNGMIWSRDLFTCYTYMYSRFSSDHVLVAGINKHFNRSWHRTCRSCTDSCFIDLHPGLAYLALLAQAFWFANRHVPDEPKMARAALSRRAIVDWSCAVDFRRFCIVNNISVAQRCRWRQSGASIPSEAMMHFPISVSDFPLFS